MSKDRILLFASGLGTTMLFCLLLYLKPYPLELLDLKLYDLLFRLRPTQSAPNSIVIAAIDERSIEKLGRWPWGRDKMALLVKRLNGLGAAVIAFDVVMSEREKHDRNLAESMEEAGNVVLPVVFFFDKEKGMVEAENEGTLLQSAIAVANPHRFGTSPPISAKDVLLPPPALANAAAGFGHINMFPDVDGTLRWEVLFLDYKRHLIPSLPLAVSAMYLGTPKERILVDAGKGLILGKRHVPTDRYGRVLIPYYGGSHMFRHIPFSDILEGKIKREEIEEKVVLVGATAVGLYDLRVTPLSPAMAGVEKHAHMIASLIEGKSIFPVPRWAVLISILLPGLVCSYLYQRLKGLNALSLLIALSCLFFSIAFLLFSFSGLWLSTAYALSNLLSQFAVIVSLSYALTEREARRVRKIFSSYVTEKVVNELVRNPSMAKLGGERREVSILFSDIRGFTSLSERLPPEVVVDLLNEYFSEMVETVFRWEGTLDKFMGDAIMVFWNAPLPQQDHAQKALRCALEMLDRLAELRRRWEKNAMPALRIGIGMNAGEVLVGNIGAEGRKMDYTVIGDHVNLASRLEGLTKQFECEIVVSEFFLKAVREGVLAERFGPLRVHCLGNVTVKGKERPVRVYKVERLDRGPSEIIEPPEMDISAVSAHD